MAEFSRSSKDLLQLERNSAAASSPSCLELLCKKDGAVSQPGSSIQKPETFPMPSSGVLGKVKDFLGVISESNKKLLHDAKENPDNYDIEVLNGKESEVIEMDLMLGIADLHTPEALAAAESAMAGNQPATYLSESSSTSDSEDSSEEEDNDDDDNNNKNKNNKINEQLSKLDSQSNKLGSKDTERDSSCEKMGKQKPKKRPKIVEL